MTAGQLAILSALMVATGALGAITGGNSLINVPLMIMVGMSPRQAVATNMFAVIFMTVSATARFARARVLRAKLLLPLGVITVVTSAFGALHRGQAARDRGQAGGRHLDGGAGGLHRPLPQERRAGRADPRARRRAGYIGTTLLGVYGGFFSGGYTTLMTVLCTVCFGLTMMESVAVTKPMNLLSCVAASVDLLRQRPHRPADRSPAGGGQPGWAAGWARTPRSRAAIASFVCCSSAPSPRWRPSCWSGT